MPLFYVKIRKNIDICNYLPIYYPAICRGWGTFSVPSAGDDLCAAGDDLCAAGDDLCVAGDDLCVAGDDLCAAGDAMQ